MRRMEEAIAAMQSAVELDPLSPFLQGLLGATYLIARRYDRAIEQYRNALDLNPHLGPAYTGLGMALILTDKPTDGIEAVETGVRLLGRSPFMLAVNGFAYGRIERIVDAQKILAEMQDLAQRAYVPSIHFAFVYLGLGEIDKALDWIERAVEERDSMTFALPFHPAFDPVHSHPRFQALIRKMNLEP
jgi:tetratricopeptide (TPR) repeat protein